jgi:hypothetical protein
LIESEDRKLRRIYGTKREAVSGGYSKMVKMNSIIRRYNSRVQITGHETGEISSREMRIVYKFLSGNMKEGIGVDGKIIIK